MQGCEVGWSTLWACSSVTQVIEKTTKILLPQNIFGHPLVGRRGSCIHQSVPFAPVFFFLRRVEINGYLQFVETQSILCGSYPPQWRWGNNDRIWSFQGHSRLGEMAFGWGVCVGSWLLCHVLISLSFLYPLCLQESGLTTAITMLQDIFCSFLSTWETDWKLWLMLLIISGAFDFIQ